MNEKKTNSASNIMRKIVINGPQVRKFKNNQIKTAKYNIFTFLPLSIIYQFNNYFNCFFLVTAIIMSIPLISSMDPGASLGPFLFVLTISIIREGIEDFKKAEYDKMYNNSKTLLYKKNEFIEERWANLKVGYIIKVMKNDVVPSDILILKSSADNGFAYLETTNLDGENALKPREAIILTNSLEDFSSINGEIEVDEPNNDIYTIDGTLILKDFEKTFFNVNNILLRGGKLKNTDYVIGIVIYSGKDTKLMQNIKNGNLKLSSIDRVLNIVVIYILLIVLFLCIITTVFGAFFTNSNLPNYETGDLGMNYIFYYTSGSGTILEIIRIFTGMFITFNTLIPISLMVTSEVVKAFQIVVMESDANMANISGERVKMLSMKLHEDLGCVKYIFTDKTGTLTRNEMLFRSASIYTILFDDENNEDQKNKKSIFASNFDPNKLISALINDIPTDLVLDNNSPFTTFKEAITEFFLNIALNHNVLTENQNGEIIFQGSNPDEVTLVTSACELGVEFLERSQNFIRLKVLNEIKVFEILQKFDFSSARMRSSIIVKDEKGIIKIYMKGGDNIIFNKIDEYSKLNIHKITKEHVDIFAKRGLRTLCYSYKIISHEEYKIFEKNYDEIKYKAINDKNVTHQVEELIYEFENNMTLLGVTALEDRLQENVTQDIQDFIEAGINVWMITGDKLDTAESIGYSCKLFNDDTEVFRIKSGTEQEVSNKLNDVYNQMKALEAEMEIKQWRNDKSEYSVEGLKGIVDNNFEDENDHEQSNLHTQKKKKTIFNSYIAKHNQNIIENFNIDLKDDKNKNDIEYSLHEMEISSTNRKIKQDTSQREIRHITNIDKEIESISKIDKKDNNTLIDFKFKNKILAEKFNHTTNPIEDNKFQRKTSVNDESIIKFMYNHNYFESQSSNLTIINKMVKQQEGTVEQIRNNISNNIKENEIIKEEEEFKDAKEKEVYNFEVGKTDENDNIDFNKMKMKSLGFNEKEINPKKSNFDKIFNYIHGKIEEIDKRKKSAFNFEFKPKKTKEQDDDEEEEEAEIRIMNFGLIIEGSSISHCLNNKQKLLFWKVMKKTRSIIACRCSPLQKAEIVNFVKNKSKEITLAIGDGGNDVNMIKTANVGVGIFGKEGFQAAFSSDYAISQFKYLRRLLFYHGRYSLVRNSYFVYFFFFKNILFSLPQLWLCFYTGFSGTNYYDSWYYLSFNSFITALPIAIHTLMEEDIDIEFKGYKNRDILKYLVPNIYKEFRDSIPFNITKFFLVFLCATVFSTVVYFIPHFAFKLCLVYNGKTFSFWDNSIASWICIVLIHFYIIIVDTNLVTWFNTSAYMLQLAIIILFIIIHEYRDSGELSGITGDLLSNINFWFVILLTCSICLLFFMVVRNGEILFSGSIINNLKRNKYYHEYEKKIYLKKLEQMNRCRRSLAKFKRLYKQKDYEAENFADKRMKEMVDMYKHEHNTRRIKRNRALSEIVDIKPNTTFRKIINTLEKNSSGYYVTTTNENIQTLELKNFVVNEARFKN